MFGVFQGRLSIPPGNQLQWFPQDCWQEEFYKCKRLNLDFIELLDEGSYNSNNPIWSSSGRDEMKRIALKTNRAIYSSCTNYTIDNSLLWESTLNHVYNYLEVSEDLGCKIAVIALMGKSSITKTNFDDYVSVIRQLCNSTNLTICLESFRDHKLIGSLIDKVNVNNIKCVFDTGNRSVSKNLSEEILFLGDRIGHIHLKDKNKRGENVYLGTGKVNFYEVFESLSKINYKESFTFESVRGTDPEKTMSYNMVFSNFFKNEIDKITDIN